LSALKHGAGTGIVLALAAAASYGWVPNFARLAFLNGVPALETVTCRTFAVVVVLAIVAVLRGDSLAPPRRAWVSLALQGCATLLVSSCYLASVQFIPVTLSVIIFYSFPLIILLAAPLIEGHMPGLWQIAVSLLGFAGLFVAVGPVFGGANLTGLLLAFLGAVGCALQFFTGRAVARHMAPAAFGCLIHLAILPIILGLALYFGRGGLAIAGGVALGPWAFTSVGLVSLAYLFGYFFHMSAVQNAPSSIVAPYFNAEPVVSIGLAVVVLGEAMTGGQMIGGAMVLAALLAGSLVLKRKVVT
jgi:drug/metabolite transporter (DMT)-like permease